MVTANRHEGTFTQIIYTENDREPDPEYVTMQIIGWVPDDALTTVQRRHFFLLDFAGRTERETSRERWQAFSDNHTFTLFWSPLTDLPKLIHPQDTWLKWLEEAVP